MKNIMLICGILFLLIACQKQNLSKNDILIQKLESKSKLDEMEKIELQDAKTMSKSNQNSLEINKAFCKIR